MSPTRRAAALVALVAVAAVLLPVPFAVLALVGVLAASLVDAFSVRGLLTVERVVAPVVSRGIRSPLTVSIVGTPAGSVAVRQPMPTAVALTPDESDGGLEASLVPQRRGRYQLDPPVLRRTGPLGLGRWDRTLDLAPIEFAVFPDLVSARRHRGAGAQGPVW